MTRRSEHESLYFWTIAAFLCEQIYSAPLTNPAQPLYANGNRAKVERRPQSQPIDVHSGTHAQRESNAEPWLIEA